MVKSRTLARQSRTALIRQLLDSPALPAYLKKLPEPVYTRLIQHIGKEDAQALMVHATDEQMRDLIETDVWNNSTPGKEEHFDPAKFLDWLEVWQDMGIAFLAAKLKALGSDTLALALDPFVVVVDLEEVGVSDYVDTFYPYGVMPRKDEHWDRIIVLLGELDGEDPEFLEEALAKCCMRRSLLVDKTYIAGNDTLEHNLSGARDRRRRDHGYITPEDASAFLHKARSSTLEQLMIEVRYDPLTALHLAAMTRQTQSPLPKDSPCRSQPAGDIKSTQDEDINASVELDALLLSHNVLQPTPVERLLAAGESTQESYLKRQLRHLSTEDAAAQQRCQNEMLYLANLLMEGSAVQGARLTEALALQGVWATCNLGLEYCVFEDPWGSEEEMLQAFLHSEPGLIKAFRIGVHLISELPERVARAVERELQSPALARQLRVYPWIKEQATYAFTRFSLSREMDEKNSSALHALLDSLLILADNTVCQQLRVLSDPFPCYPLSLDPAKAPDVHVDKRWRFIETPGELMRSHELVQEIRLL